MVIDLVKSYSRQFLFGASRYATTHGDVAIRTLPLWSFVDTTEWQHWNVSGMIMQIFDQEMLECARKLQVPVVNVTGTMQDTGFPTVRIDYAKCARMAVEYFIDHGFHHMAYFGSDSYNSVETEAAFLSLTREAGVTGHAFDCALRDIWKDSGRAAIGEWLCQLPKPVAVLAVNDEIAAILLDICSAFGVSVPEQAAILGCWDDELYYRRTWPPLSSIVIDGERIGFEAVKTIVQILDGEAVPPVQLIPPVSIVTRMSTDIMAINDKEIAEAVRFIRQNARRGVTVDDVASQFPFSRRVFERRFRAAMGRSPMEEIVRAKLDLAKQLLVETDLQMPAIAERCGFSSATHFGVVFHRNLDITPTEYRREHSGRLTQN